MQHTTDEVSLVDVIFALQKSRRTVAIFALGVTVLAVGVWLVLPKQYEVTALIQTARVGIPQFGGTSVGPLSVPVESNGLVIHRLQASSLRDRLSQEVQLDAKIRATEGQTPGLVFVMVRARSRATAERATALAIGELAKVHADLAAPALNSIRQHLKAVQQEAANNSALSKDIRSSANQAGKLADHDATVISRLIQGQLEGGGAALNDQRLRLELALAPMNTSPTMAIQGIRGSDNPVGPGLPALVIAALFGGALLGLLVSLATQALKTRPPAIKGR